MYCYSRVVFIVSVIALCFTCEACVYGLRGNVPEEMFNTIWTYNESKAAKKHGLLPPSLWKNSFGSCDTKLKSQMQSPIDISHTDVPLGSGGVMPLSFGNLTCPVKVRNIGATLSLTPQNYDTCKASFKTASGTVYKFYEAHLHWHKYYNHRGTEHKVDGQAEAVEAHIVHYDSRFKSIDDAFEDGSIGNIAIVAIRYTVAPTAENATEASALSCFISETFSDLHYMNLDKSVNLKDPFNPYDLIGTAIPLDDNLPLYHYNGSLTTPRCDSIVSWYIVQQTVMLSQAQVHQLRFFSHVTEQEEKNPKLGFNNDANIRPVVPINSRDILAYPTIIEPNASSDSAPGDDSGIPTWELAVIIGGSVLGFGIIFIISLVLVLKVCKKKEYSSINSSA